MSTLREQALDALADIEHQASGGLEIDPALFRTVRAALSAAPAPQPAGGEREAFEAWCSKRGQDYERLGDGYTNDLVQRTWQGWQARADLSQPAAQAAEVEALRAQRDIAIDMLAHWCEAVDTNGTGWDDWDEHYKDAAYRPTPIRELINAARAALKEQTPNVKLSWSQRPAKE